MANPKIYTYTVIRSAAESFKNETPYVIAIIEEGKKKILARIEGLNERTEIGIGMEVDFVKNDERGNPVYRLK